MRFADLLGLALSALAQQKLRTLLTTLGVVFGAFVLVISLSLGQGVQDTITRESRRYDRLRRIEIYPQWGAADTDVSGAEVKGEMSSEKRERIRKAIVQRLPRNNDKPNGALTRDRLAALERLEHVEAVKPVINQYGWAVFNGKAVDAYSTAGPADTASFQGRLVAGRHFTSPTERAALVSEYLLYQCGITDDDAVHQIPGQKVRLEFRSHWGEPGLFLTVRKGGGSPLSRDEELLLEKVKKQLPASIEKLDLAPGEKDAFRKLLPGSSPQPRPADELVLAEEFTIAGVLRLSTEDDKVRPWEHFYVDADVVLPPKTAEELFLRVPHQTERGFDHVTVTVDREAHVKAVNEQIKEMGLNTSALLDFIERERFQYLMIFSTMTCVAAVALVVASLGIINTMLMSVLERTREVGVMKAVGAADRHIQLIFLLEGALIGLVGGGLGLLLGWLASKPADAWVRSMVSREMKIDLEGSLFVFPPWLTLGTVGFAMLVTTLAAVYPARRAAKVNPVTALRHE